MGYNTVMVLYNDTMDMGAKDQNIGAKIWRASRNWSNRDRDPMGAHVHYSTENSSGSYGIVVSQEHADATQIVLVRRNNGQRLQDCETLPGDAAWQMIRALEKAGYKVTPPKKSK